MIKKIYFIFGLIVYASWLILGNIDHESNKWVEVFSPCAMVVFLYMLSWIPLNLFFIIYPVVVYIKKDPGAGLFQILRQKKDTILWLLLISVLSLIMFVHFLYVWAAEEAGF